MKKLITSVFLTMFTFVAFSQSNFFTPTSYRGAIDSDSTKDWTKGWTNWDPNNTIYSDVTDTISGGDITSNTTWTKNKVYLLNDGYVYVTNNATLTIEPGTVIRGTGKGTLIIARGAKLNARGTLAEPIVFTSNNGTGLRAPGNWGGLVFTGKAVHNLPQGDTAAAEGGIAKPVVGGGLIDGRHGGTDDEDSSGVLTFVRVEYAGIPLSTASNSEINGITFYSVGRKTLVDHVQVSYSGDDSYEWFGGTVNAKHIIAFAGIDDDFEITDEIIDEILAAYKKPPDPVDEEKLSLQLANKRFNQNVKGIIDITKDDDVDEDDDWVPSVAIDTKTKLEWEKIQDKLDKIKNKFEEMTSL